MARRGPGSWLLLAALTAAVAATAWLALGGRAAPGPEAASAAGGAAAPDLVPAPVEGRVEGPVVAREEPPGPDDHLRPDPAGRAAPTAAGPPEAPDPLVDDPEDAVGPFVGVCLDEAGRRLEGATVVVTSGWNRRGGGVDPRAFAAAASGTDGAFEIQAPPAVASLRVRATAPGRVSERSDAEVLRTEVRAVVLRRVCEVRVRVLSSAGAAVPGAFVQLRAGTGEDAVSSGPPYVWAPLAEATTGADGRVVLPSPGGSVAVSVSAEGWRDDGEVGRWVPAAGVDLEIVLTPAPIVSGRVVGDDGRGVPGAVVALRLPPSTWERSVTTDGEGGFAVAVPGDSLLGLRATVRAPGFPDHHFLVGQTAHLPPLVLRVRARPVAMGRVVDLEQKPVADATVVACVGAGEDAAPVAEARTGPDGTFQIETATGDDLMFEVRTGVEPSITCWILRERAEFREDGVWRTLLLVLPVPGPALEPAPEPAANIDFRVRVVDAQGQGVAGARLEAGYVVGIPHKAFELTGRARTDAEGRAVVVGRPLPDSPPLVVVYPPGRPAFSAALPRTVQESRAEVEIALPAGGLRGRLRAPEGEASRVPLSLRLEVCPGTRVGDFALVPDAEGRFVAEGLGPRDAYVLGARGPDVLVNPPRQCRAGDSLDLVVATPEQAYGLCVEVQLDLASSDGQAPGTGALEWRKDGLLSMLVDLLPLPEPGVWRSARPLPPGPCHLDVLFPGFLPVPFEGVLISSLGPPLRLRVDLRR